VLNSPTRKPLDLLTLCTHALCFDTLAHCFALREMLTFLFSNTTAPFGKSNYGVGYPLGGLRENFRLGHRGAFSPLSKIVLQSL